MKWNSYTCLKNLFSCTLTFGLVFQLFGCADLLHRSQTSGYAGNNSYDVEEPNVRRDRETVNYEDTVSELGFDGSRALTPEQKKALSTRLELKNMEKDIGSRREREQYFKVKPMFANDRERIEFLKMNSFESKQRWLDARGLSTATQHYTTEIQDLIEQNDIAVGMTKQAVHESWGDPEVVEVAGNPMYGNERWKYVEYVSSVDGYQTETRIVYFEAGRVAGWEKF